MPSKGCASISITNWVIWRRGLDAALESLEVGGRLVVISFHSLEDRIVKLFMRKHAKGEMDKLPRDLPIIPKGLRAALEADR